MSDSEATEGHTPIVIRWAYWIVNGIFVGVILSMLGFRVMEGFGKNTVNSPAAWIAAYACWFGLMLAAVFFVMLLVHAVEARTMAFLKGPFVLLVLLLLSWSVSTLVYDR